MRGIRVAILVAFLSLPGCLGHIVQVEPVEVEPIHMTVDVQVQVDEPEAERSE